MKGHYGKKGGTKVKSTKGHKGTNMGDKGHGGKKGKHGVKMPSDRY